MSDHHRLRGPALDQLLRWEEFGGHWRVSARTASLLHIELLTCDGGEVSDRMETDDVALIAHVGNRITDQDDAGSASHAS